MKKKQSVLSEEVKQSGAILPDLPDASLANICRSILGGQDVALSIRDNNFKPVYANSAFLELFGITHDDWSCDDWASRFSSDSLRRIYDTLIPEVLSGRKWRGEIEILTRNKRKKQVLSEWTSILDEEGEITHFYALHSEMTRMKELQNELTVQNQYLNRIIDTLPDPLVIKSSDHVWIAVNEAFCRLLGRSKEEVLGKSDPDFLPPNQTEVFWRLDNEALRSDEPIAYEASVTNSKGETRMVSSKKVTIDRYDGEKVIVTLARDVTTEKKLEQNISDSYFQLEAGLTALKSELNDVHNRVSSSVSRTEAIRGLLERSNSSFFKLFHEEQGDSPPPSGEGVNVTPLSPREYQVFMLLVQGYRVKDAAEHLGVSANSVSTYRSRILKKLGLTSITEMIQYAMRIGII